jgi:hypothetical protein
MVALEVSVDEFSCVAAFRQELQTLPLVRLDDTQLAYLRARLLVGHHNNAIEGIEPSSELAALFEMFLQGRAARRVT